MKEIANSIANRLDNSREFELSKKKLKKIVIGISKAATHYRHWEEEVQTPGIALVLGNEISETS
jgi:hypothetical protein